MLASAPMKPTSADTTTATPPQDLTYVSAKEKALDDFHATYLNDLLARTGGNISKAARQSGLDRSNFRRVLRRYKHVLDQTKTEA